MKTLALSQGDLVVGRDGFTTVSGAQKVQTQLALLLGEYFGTDRFHPTQWGSTVTDYIGDPNTLDVEFEVRSEIARALTQYIAIQDQEIYQDFLDGRRSRFAAADVIREVTSIETQMVNESIFVTIDLVTLAGQTVRLNRTVTL